VTEYVPVAVPVGTATVNMDVPELVIDVGLKVAVSPLGAVEESETVPAYPLREFTVIVEVPEDPALMVIGLGDAETVKSGVV
jgi:hypothetical protein